MDVISITDLSLSSIRLAPDLWLREGKLQPLLVSISIFTDIKEEAQSDSLLSDSLNYGTVTKCVEIGISNLEDRGAIGWNLEELSEYLIKLIIFECGAIDILLKLSQSRSLLTADSIGIISRRSRADYTLDSDSVPILNLDCEHFREDKFIITGLRRFIIIGINECERVDQQEVIVDLEFASPMSNTIIRQGWKNWRAVTKSLEAHLTSSRPLTIESLTTDLAKIILTPSGDSNWDVPTTTVKISKPSALQFAKYPSVQITRTRNDFFNSLELNHRATSSLSTSSITSSMAKTESLSQQSEGESENSEMEGINRVILGVGSNLGLRLENIDRALKELDKLQVKLIETSFLYESDAMYLEDQPKFLNAVVVVETLLEPLALLEVLKGVENLLGREKTIRNGPRPIDLDILFYNDLVLNSPKKNESDERWLCIPHASIAEREFVLRPLADLTSPPVHPILKKTPTEILNSLLSTIPSSIHRVLPLSSSISHKIGSRTLIMSIINATPDSFSDGGDNATILAGLATVKSHINLGVDIVDIGGMSTRPGAEDVEEEEEIKRVVPLIQEIRKFNEKILISIDTFRPIVAQAAILAGANIINDVLGGSTPGMLEMMKELNVPVILMHSRGTPQTMGSLTHYESGVVEGVEKEMKERIQAAEEKGIKKWNIILDPGIGFAKTQEDNIQLLKNLEQVLLSNGNFPTLVGLSRKKFLGTITGKMIAKGRVFGTAAGVSCCIQNGTDIVRIHDVVEMIDVVKVADAIYR